MSCRTEGVLDTWLGTEAGREGQRAAAQTCLGMCTPGCPDTVVWDGGVSWCCSTSSASSGFELAWL